MAESNFIPNAGNLGFISTVTYVDLNTEVPLAKQNGGLLTPFATGQQAFDANAALLNRSGVLGIRHVDRINFAQGDYDEEWTINLTNRHLELVGKWRLGVFDQDRWRPVDPPALEPRRNINLIGDTNAPDDINPSLLLMSDSITIDPTEGNDEFDNIPAISGAIISNMTNSAAGTNGWTLIVQAQVYGTTGDETGVSIDCTGDQALPSPAAPVNLQMMGSRVRGAVNLGIAGRFADGIACRFDGDQNYDIMGRFQNSRFAEMTWTLPAVTSGVGTPLKGFTNCRFDGAQEWIGPHDILVDGYSNDQMLAQGVDVSSFTGVFVYTGGAPLVDLFRGGAATIAAGEFWEAEATRLGGTAAALGGSTQTGAQGSARLASISFDFTAAPTPNVTMKVFIGGVERDSVTVTDTQGSVPLTSQFLVNANDLVAVEFDAGAVAPGASTVRVYGR